MCMSVDDRHMSTNAIRVKGGWIHEATAEPETNDSEKVCYRFETEVICCLLSHKTSKGISGPP